MLKPFTRQPTKRRAMIALAVIVAGLLTTNAAASWSGLWLARVDVPAQRSGPLVQASKPSGFNALLVSDSAWLSIKNRSAYDAVRGFHHELALASCRRRVAPSCTNYDGSVPLTLLKELQNRQPGQFDTLIVATGYNDSDHNFKDDFIKIVNQARAIDIRQIVWLTLRENVTYVSPDRSGYGTVFVNNNQTLRDLVAVGDYPEVVIADWATYARQPDYWFSDRDGIHLTKIGSFAAADYISRKIAFLNGWPCAMPVNVGATPQSPCPDPDAAPPQADIEALYPVLKYHYEQLELIWTGSGSWPNPPWWENP